MNPEEIRALRERLGLSRERFAERLRVSSSAVLFWERGVVPNRKNLEDLLALRDATLEKEVAHE